VVKYKMLLLSLCKYKLLSWRKQPVVLYIKLYIERHMWFYCVRSMADDFELDIEMTIGKVQHVRSF